MNKVVLMGRLTRDPEVRYAAGSDRAITLYTLAVNRPSRGSSEAEVDFINCVAFGKNGQFVDKWFKKGQLVAVIGRLCVNSWDDNGTRRYSTNVITEEHYFTGDHSGSSDNSKPNN